MRQDSDVKHDVESKLKCEPDFDASDIALAVKNGVEGPAEQLRWTQV